MTTPRRRQPNPTWYFVLGAMWSVLAVGQWGVSDSVVAKVGFTFIAVANLAMGVVTLRRQRRANRPDASGA
ncbi:hypothetical protein [Blastococcus saxobsidens]|uniref:hypothetical protein n=1 Tax=Blastococcus saxobsidens TaxID=138336 RepID=UPI00140FEC9A|nr:hypothetical protein [Blastococcus saxobsidens]